MMNNVDQKVRATALERVLLVFFVLAVLFALGVSIVDPSIYAKMLSLAPFPADRYPLPVMLFLVGLVVFLALLSVGVVRHWRWVFWLVLVAMGASVLQVPVAIFQFAGVLSDPYPVWYSLLRMGVAIVEVGIAVWMIRIYQHSGVWAMGRKKNKRSLNEEKSEDASL
jgi:hypothetical protein